MLNLYQITTSNFAKFASRARLKSGGFKNIFILKKLLGVAGETFYEICLYFAIIHLTYITILSVFNCFNKLVFRVC